MYRRDFLRPSHLAAVTAQTVAAVGVHSKSLPEPEQGELGLIRASRRAMATDFEVAFPLGNANALASAEALLDEIDRVEDQLTVYRESSEIIRVNRNAADGPVRVDDSVFQLLALAERLHQSTDGAFDITAGPLIKAWGFFRRCHRFPSASELKEALSRVGLRHMRLDAGRRTVTFRKTGVELNLGSIGKGFALDRAAEVLQNQGVTSALLHGGHSSVYALGSPPGDVNGWRITVRHPWDAERRLAVLRLRDRGLATSATTFQSFETGGRRFGHIIDPRTGWPARGMASVTVVAPTAAEADALATAFFICGVDWTRRFCETHPEVSAVMLPNGVACPVYLNFRGDELEF